MKPIITTNLTGIALGSLHSGAERAEDEARLRRNAERLKLQRIQADAHRHADAESRLAEAMSRAAKRSAAGAAARAAQSATSPAQAKKLDPLTGQAAAGEPLAPITDEPAHGGPAGAAAEIARDMARLPLNPAHALRELLAGGQSRGLMQDCSALLESLAGQLAAGSVAELAQDSDAREALDCTLEFLQGYAESSAARLTGSERLAQRVAEIRQHLQAMGLEASMGGASVAAGGPQALLQGLDNPGADKQGTGKQGAGKQGAGKQGAGKQGAGKPAELRKAAAHTVKGSDRTTPLRKGWHESDDGSDADGEATNLAVAAVAAGTRAEPGNVTGPGETSLDKDQRKRREDTLPLVTLRSI